MQGIVKFYNDKKGYGFIMSNNDSEDYFFHINDVVKNDVPNKGDVVSFEIGENRGKKCAVRVVIKNNSVEKFIKIQETRIKISNIKDYGIGHTELVYRTHYSIPENLGFLGTLQVLLGDDNINGSDIDYYERTFSANPWDGESHNQFLTVAYLYITTYQGDNYEFTDSSINKVKSKDHIGESFVQKYISKLDEYFGNL